MRSMIFRAGLWAILLAAGPLLAQQPNPNARFGLPSPAKTDVAQRDDYLIERPQYVLSYNAQLRRPNWVSWRCSAPTLVTRPADRSSPIPCCPGSSLG